MTLTRKEIIVCFSVLFGLIFFVISYTPKETDVNESLVIPAPTSRNPSGNNGEYLSVSSIELEKIPPNEVEDRYFKEVDGRTVTYFPVNEQRVVTYQGNEIRDAIFYPDRSELGFYYATASSSEGIQDYRLVILDTQSGKFKEIYKDDYHFSSWMWNEFDTVTVRRDCGTQCIRAKMFNFKTGKTIAEYFEF